MSCDRSPVPFAWSPAIELVQSPPNWYWCACACAHLPPPTTRGSSDERGRVVTESLDRHRIYEPDAHGINLPTQYHYSGAPVVVPTAVRHPIFSLSR